jgi:hypothetical protein
MEGLQGVIAKVGMENRKKNRDEKTKIVGILPSQIKKNQAIHLHYYNLCDEHPTYSPLLIHAPMYDRSDIRNMDEKVKLQADLPPISPFDKNTFQAKNRRECEAWCKIIMERVMGKDIVEEGLKRHEEAIRNDS